jgi:hypothetical protein
MSPMPSVSETNDASHASISEKPKPSANIPACDVFSAVPEGLHLGLWETPVRPQGLLGRGMEGQKSGCSGSGGSVKKGGWRVKTAGATAAAGLLEAFGGQESNQRLSLQRSGWRQNTHVVDGPRRLYRTLAIDI